MKRPKFLLLLFALTTLASSAQTIAMRDVLVAMPDSLLPLLTAVNRADCIDFLEADMPARVTNRMGTTTELTHLTADYARLQYTECTVYELKLLPLSDTLQVLCLTHRLQEPVNDAHVSFYNMQWTSLPVSRFFRWTPATEPTSLLTTCDYALSPTSTDLVVTLHNECYQHADSTAEAALQVSSIPYIFHWADGRYNLAE